MNRKILYIAIALAMNGCTQNGKEAGASGEGAELARFGEDLAFLRRHHNDLIVLGGEGGGARVVVAPAYQGRVMTSTAEGDGGMSFGWINRELISSGRTGEHIHAVGGEERFWLGPEGGQFSLYFKQGSAFTFENWQVPKEIDTEPFELLHADDTVARFRRRMSLVNYSGHRLEMEVDRSIRLLDRAGLSSVTGELPTDIAAVGFVSENRLTNTGASAWDRATGMPSIWILSMLNAGEGTTIALPYRRGDSAVLGRIVTDDYFGKVPADRLKVADGLILMKADAGYRSKVGISPRRALPFAAGYDRQRGVLTIAHFSLPEGRTDYVNSLWQIQEDPFSGDAVNAYNDGPVDGKQMGRFYELESSSPAAALAPGGRLTHLHHTIHLKGPEASLDIVCRRLLGVGLEGVSL